ncbi:MAG: transcriptional regulator [Acidobacteria bacterium RIFCSPLOWO2_12_FULL_65_11]|nr:MAG: transcriptional regulator [Acidobacteria bacterium RIFCSPLOWO2_02_FULL_64_15]OFW34479.1 MAG: transcriptional regulator [Acidobacteria bacterium RIFCSPLOWO2_12_FULL_65_11]
MFYNDHAPPHFHAEYGEHEVLMEIETRAVYAGSLPPRALALVREWAAAHQEDLRTDWSLARSGRAPEPIAPLE